LRGAGYENRFPCQGFSSDSFVDDPAAHGFANDNQRGWFQTLALAFQA
jgi:hypothetical protein